MLWIHDGVQIERILSRSIGHFGVLDSTEGSILRWARFFGGLGSLAGSILRWARFFGGLDSSALYCGLFGRLTELFSFGLLIRFWLFLKEQASWQAAYFISSEMLFIGYFGIRGALTFDLDL